MKTKLKVGDKVYDSALFGDLEGEVIIVNEDSPYPISVRFRENPEDYTLDGRTYKGFNATLSMKSYDKLSEIVPVWEEEEVLGLFWDNDDSAPKLYAQMVKSDNKNYPFKVKELNYIYKQFKETGKLM